MLTCSHCSDIELNGLPYLEYRRDFAGLPSPTTSLFSLIDYITNCFKRGTSMASHKRQRVTPFTTWREKVKCLGSRDNISTPYLG